MIQPHRPAGDGLPHPVLGPTPAISWPIGVAGGRFGFAVGSRGLPKCWLTSRLALVGTFSYSIYLWHAAIVSWTFPNTSWQHVALYFVASIVIGVGLAKLIEMPALRLREVLVPAGAPDAERGGDARAGGVGNEIAALGQTSAVTCQ